MADYKRKQLGSSEASDLLPADVSALHVRWLDLGGLGPDPAALYIRGLRDGERKAGKVEP